MNDKNILEYIEQRLDEWAEWFTLYYENELGYPSQSLTYRLMTEGYISKSTTPNAVFVNEDAEEIESLVSEMAKQNHIMALSLHIHYLVHGSVRAKAKKFSIARNKLMIYVEMAKQWLAGRLSSVEGG
jgi:hypothetical protein